MDTLTSIPAPVVPQTPVRPPSSLRGEHMRSLISDPRFWLVCYLSALVVVAFWPVHVDRDARDVLDATSRAVTWLTYERIEFSANIVMFVPLGFLLLKIRGGPVFAIVALACCASLSIEIVQGTLLPERTQSVLDVVAHTLGAALGAELAMLLRPAKPRR